MTDQERICKNCKHWRHKANGIGECTATEEPLLDPLGVAYASDTCEGWEHKDRREQFLQRLQKSGMAKKRKPRGRGLF